MKKVLLLSFIVSLFVGSASAQGINYHPFVEEGKIWHMQGSLGSPDSYYNFDYFITGDTVISRHNCKKFYVYNELNSNKTEYKMAVYETEARVYFIPKGDVNSCLLYDFRIPVGDEVVINEVVHPERNIWIKNNEDRYFYINGTMKLGLLVNRVADTDNDVSSKNLPSGWWIEGVGSELGPLNTWLFDGMGSPLFIKCEVNGNTIFDRHEFVTHVTAITRSKFNTKIVFDLTGRRLNSVPEKGMYIKDGKKWLRK